MRFIVCELVKACGVLLISTVVIGGCGDPADPAENDGNQTNANQVNANDSPEPELSLEATPEEVTSETKAVFEFDANVDDPVFDCRIDSGDWESCDSPQTYEELDDGDRLFEVQLLDDGGEPLDASASFEWTVDTVAPETTLTEVPEDPASETTAHFEFEADDPDATFECRHDASWDECSSPHELSDLEPGEHHFQVRATDSVGNTEESAAEYTWEIVVATDWAEFSTGKRHVCGVTQEGALYCWGSNETHQLGISQEGFGEQNVPFPQPVGDDEDWAHISAGAEHSCGIRQDGSLWCWGSREYGALGDGQAEDESTPEPQLISDEQWDDVDTGANSYSFGYLPASCGIQADGTLWCWGHNGEGQLGQGGFEDYSEPQQVGDRQDWEKVITNDGVSCGIRSGELYCWGRNPDSSLPVDDDRESIDEPQRVGDDSNWSDVELGHYESSLLNDPGHGCGIESGELHCWGEFPAEQSGALSQVGVDNDWESITAARESVCGTRSNGTLWCFGHNFSGVLGLEEAGEFSEPVQVGSGDDWQDIDMASYSGVGMGTGLAPTPFSSPVRHLCGLREAAEHDGQELACWGQNHFGQRGQGHLTSIFAPMVVDTDQSWTALSAGSLNTCAINDAEELWCWGYNTTTTVTKGYEPVPREYGEGQQWTDVSASRPLNCALNTDHELWCWGSGDSDIFDDGDTEGAWPSRVTEPTQIGEDVDWQEVSTSPDDSSYSNYLCGIDTSDSLWCLGANGDGQLGDGTNEDRQQPQSVDDEEWQSVDTSQRHACGIRADSTLWCWGSNADGRLGTGDTEDSDNPVQVGDDDDWEHVVAGHEFSCGLRDGGTAYCWGANSHGQLGDDTLEPSSSPVEVDGDHDWVELVVTNRELSKVCGVTQAGPMYCWGNEERGSLGTGEDGSFREEAPVEVIDVDDFTAGAVGWGHSCGIESSGDLYCWGTDLMGQLGLNLDMEPIPQVVEPTP